MTLKEIRGRIAALKGQHGESWKEKWEESEAALDIMRKWRDNQFARAERYKAALESASVIATESIGCVDMIDYADDMNRIITIAREALGEDA